jgi:hypothetical protein
MFHLLFENFENVTGNTVNSALGINQKQPDFSGFSPGKIKDSYTTALALTPTVPAHLTNPAGTAHHIASIWIGGKECLKNTVFVVGQVIMNLLRKQR